MGRGSICILYSVFWILDSMYTTLQIPSVIAEEKKNLQSAERESLLLEQERCEPADLTLQIAATEL